MGGMAKESNTCLDYVRLMRVWCGGLAGNEATEGEACCAEKSEDELETHDVSFRVFM
jgi:hypothetical protein